MRIAIELDQKGIVDRILRIALGRALVQRRILTCSSSPRTMPMHGVLVTVELQFDGAQRGTEDGGKTGIYMGVLQIVNGQCIGIVVFICRYASSEFIARQKRVARSM